MKITTRINSSKQTISYFFFQLFKGKLLYGENIEKFEKRLKEYVGVKHAIISSSARYALYLIMSSLDIKKGEDEIIIPSYMPLIVAQVAKLCGLKIVFADINPDSFNIDPDEIEKKITKNTKILLIVHLYGVPCNMDKILEIVKKHDLFLIEDAAQALGASYKDQKIGSFGHASVVSFGQCKNLNTLGGGVILTDDYSLSAKIRDKLNDINFPKKRTVLKNLLHNKYKRLISHPYFFSLICYPFIKVLLALKLSNMNNASKFVTGFKYKVNKESRENEEFYEKKFKEQYEFKYTNFQAIAGLKQFKEYDDLIRKQNKNAEYIKKSTRNYLPLPDFVKPAYFCCTVQVKNRNKTLTRLFKSGILANTVHYNHLSEFELIDGSKCTRTINSKVINKIVNHIIYIPFKIHLKDRNLKIISKILKDCS